MNINLSITETNENIDFDFGLDAYYTGSYEPVSALGEQTLDTANKVMLGNITIKPIPVSKVVAPSGNGYTVTIG